MAEILLELGCKTKTKNVEVYSPLHYAARNNNVKLTKLLLQYGADANVKSDKGKVTLLHLAALTESVQAAQALIEHGVDMEATYKLDQTPLTVAAAYGRLPAFLVLLFNGGNVHTRDRSGKHH